MGFAGSLWINDFTGIETQEMLRGQVEIDIEQWRAQTVELHNKSVGEAQAGQVLGWFWQIFGNFDQEELQNMLKFVSGMSCMPLGGFKDTRTGHFELVIVSGEDQKRLPSARTCFNSLSIPAYSSMADLGVMLKRAIARDEGFEMA